MCSCGELNNWLCVVLCVLNNWFCIVKFRNIIYRYIDFVDCNIHAGWHTSVNNFIELCYYNTQVSHCHSLREKRTKKKKYGIFCLKELSVGYLTF